MGFALRSSRNGGGLLAAASDDSGVIVRREFAYGKDASDADTARRGQQTSRSIGGSGASPAELKLIVLQKININLPVGVCGADRNRGVDLVRARLGNLNAVRVEPTATNGAAAGCRKSAGWAAE